MTNQFGKLILLDTRNLLSVKYLLIKTIYSIDNNRDYSLEYWINRINEIKKKKFREITPVKDKTIQVGWCVYLPEFLDSKPRSKYFYFTSFKDRNEALNAAVDWINNVINKWLIDQGYNINPLN